MTRSASTWAERGGKAKWRACTVSKSRVVFRRVIRRPKTSTRRTVTPGKIGETSYHTPALRRGYRRLNSGLSRACISDMGNLASVYVGTTSIGPREGLRGIVAVGPNGVNAPGCGTVEDRTRCPGIGRCRLSRILRSPSPGPILVVPTYTLARLPMSEMPAPLKPEFSLRYPRLSAGVWYDVSPIFPGVTVRRVDVFGRRITRLKTTRDFETVQARHFAFPPRSAQVEAERVMA